MAYNEIILQCYVLEPVFEANSSTLTKTEMFTEKQIVPLLLLSSNSQQQQLQQPQPQQQQSNIDAILPLTPTKLLSIDINPFGATSSPTSRYLYPFFYNLFSPHVNLK